MPAEKCNRKGREQPAAPINKTPARFKMPLDQSLTLIATIATALTAVAALIASLYIPRISQSLANREAIRRDAREVFVKVNQDIQNFQASLFLCQPHPHFAELSPEQLISMAHQATSAVEAAIASLNGDRLMLQLVFGQDSNILVDSLRNLIRDTSPTPHGVKPLAELAAIFEKLYERVAVEMKALWDSLS